MTRDTKSAYRARGAKTHAEIDAELARQRAESDARIAAARDLERVDRAKEGSIDRDTIIRHLIHGLVYVRDSSGWRRVLEVNQRSVTVPSRLMADWTDTVRFEKIREVKS